MSLLLSICIDLLYGPIFDAMLSGAIIGISSNILNDGEFLWSLDE